MGNNYFMHQRYKHKVEPVEYDQTHSLVEQYTSDTPENHHCGLIAQSVEKLKELKYTVFDGEVADGKESIRSINYNAVFTYAVKAIQELHDIVKEQQMHIDELKAKIP